MYDCRRKLMHLAFLEAFELGHKKLMIVTRLEREICLEKKRVGRVEEKAEILGYGFVRICCAREDKSRFNCYTYLMRKTNEKKFSFWWITC